MSRTTARLRTLIVDDEPLAIERMQVLCAELEQLAVVGTASDGEAALRLADKLKPDLLLLDMTMPGLDGLGVARALGQARQPAGGDLRHRARGLRGRGVRSRSGRLRAQAGRRRTARAGDRPRHRPARAAVPPAQAANGSASSGCRTAPSCCGSTPAQVERIDAERDYVRLHVGARRSGRSYLLLQTIAGLEGAARSGALPPHPPLDDPAPRPHPRAAPRRARGVVGRARRRRGAADRAHLLAQGQGDGRPRDFEPRTRRSARVHCGYESRPSIPARAIIFARLEGADETATPAETGREWTMLRLGLLAAMLCVATPAFAQDSDEYGWTPLFNGENLDGWKAGWAQETPRAAATRRACSRSRTARSMPTPPTRRAPSSSRPISSATVTTAITG